MKRALVKSTAMLIIITILSKIFGFVREMAIAFFFGANIYTDAYLVALAIPVVIFMAVKGAIQNVFIPVYDTFKGEQREKALTAKFVAVGLAATILFIVVPVLLQTEGVVKIFAPGFGAEENAIAAAMARVLVLIVIFQFLIAVASAVLHVNRNFVVPGCIWIPNSLVIIAASALFSAYAGIEALVWGTLAGAAVQLVVILPWLIKIKLAGKVTAYAGDGLRQIGLMLPPVLLGTLAGQLKTLIDRMFASGLMEGSVSYLNYAEKIYQLPVGFLVMAVVTVMYPTLVSFANNGKAAEYNKTLAAGIRHVLFFIFPIVAGFWVLAVPITEIVYQRGSFGWDDTVHTAAALKFFSTGLVGITLHHLLIKGFYALKDTKTPMIAMFIMVSVNTGFNLLFIGHLAHRGLALATSLAFTTGAIYMLVKITRKLGVLLDRQGMVDLFKSACAAGVMGLFCHVAYAVSAPYLELTGFAAKAIYVGALIGLGGVVYLALALAFKIETMRQVIAMGIGFYNHKIKKAA